MQKIRKKLNHNFNYPHNSLNIKKVNLFFTLEYSGTFIGGTWSPSIFRDKRMNGYEIVFSQQRYSSANFSFWNSDKFECPIDGTYYFALNMMQSNYNRTIDLKIGDDVVFRLKALNPILREHQITGSNSAIFRCNRGKF